MTTALAILLLCWALLRVFCLIHPAWPGAALGAAWAGLGLVCALLAAREEAWPLGEWSQDLNPLAVFTMIALFTVVLERLAVARGIGWSTLRETMTAAASGVARPWYLAGVATAGFALALLGRSGLALAIAACQASALGAAALTGREATRA